MKNAGSNHSLVQQIAATVAVLFGVVTLLAGGRILFGGADPGYPVFQPLLIYNTLMGVVYVGAGFAIWRNLVPGIVAAGTIFVLNLCALGAIVSLYSVGVEVAGESLKAMSFRTVVWLVLLALLIGLARRHGPLAESIKAQ